MKYFILILLLGSFVARAENISLSLHPKNGKVQFEAVGRPSMVKIKGQGEGASGKVVVQANKLSGDFKFMLSSMDTGIGLRNEHMKEKYLEVKSFPEATLTLKEIVLPENWSLASPEVPESTFAGTLELHGVKKDIQGTFQVTGQKAVEAKFEIKISDFKIDVPSYLGITVADSVKVQVVVNDFTK